MANEITALECSGEDQKSISVVFRYDIPTPKQVGGSNVVLTPSAGLPDLAARVFTQAEKDALDAGTAAFEVKDFFDKTGLTGPQLVTRVKAAYATANAAFQAAYTARYRFAGTRVDA